MLTQSKQGSYKNQDYPKFQLEKVQNKGGTVGKIMGSHGLNSR